MTQATGAIGPVLARLGAATADLVATLDGLSDDQARARSRLPGWTRGHVLTHLARNAEGSTRLLTWARTGIPGHEYESVTARAAAIEAGAGRPARGLAADVRATAEALAAAAAAVPDHHWDHVVTWTTGEMPSEGTTPLDPPEPGLRYLAAPPATHRAFGPVRWAGQTGSP